MLDEAGAIDSTKLVELLIEEGFIITKVHYMPF